MITTNNNTEEQIRFCAKFLSEHGIDTPEQYTLLLNSLQPTEVVYELVKVNNKNSMFEDMATQLKQLWPSGTREINGRRYPWQDSVKNLTIRLKQLWNSKGFGDKYTTQDVLKCAREYLSDYEEDTKYMLSLPFWIAKEKTITDAQGKTKRLYTSKMADLLESAVTSNTTDSWEDIFTDFNMGEII